MVNKLKLLGGGTPAPPKLFVFAGQSNLDGADRLNLPAHLAAVDPKIQEWTGSSFVNRQNGVNSSILGGLHPGNWGPEAEFLYQYRRAHPNETVYCLKLGISGTGIFEQTGVDDWNVNSVGQYWDQLVNEATQAKAAIPGLVVPVLVWEQGGRDATQQTWADVYEANLTALFAAFRSEIGDASTRIIVGRINILLPSGSFPAMQTVRDAQHAVAAADPLTDLISVDHYGIHADNTHYTFSGLVQLGYDAYVAAGYPVEPYVFVDSDAAAYVAAMATEPDAVHQRIIDDYVIALKAGGAWTGMDWIWLIQHTGAASLINLKNPAQSMTIVQPTTAVGFTAYKALTFNGVDNYADTSFNMLTGGGNYTQNSALIGVRSQQRGALPSGSGAFEGVVINPRRTGDLGIFRINQTGLSTCVSTASQVLAIANRSGVNATSFDMDGVAKTVTVLPNQTSIPPPNATFRFGVYETQFIADVQVAGYIGGSLGSTARSALAAADLYYIKAVGGRDSV